MTLIVGIVARDAIVMGSDGQITSGNHKEVNRRKVTCLPFPNRSVFVAESGMASLSSQAVEYLRQKCMRILVQDSDVIPNLTVEAVRHVRNHQRDRNQKLQDLIADRAARKLEQAFALFASAPPSVGPPEPQ